MLAGDSVSAAYKEKTPTVQLFAPQDSTIKLTCDPKHQVKTVMLLPGSNVAVCLFTRDSRRDRNLSSQYLTSYVDMKLVIRV